MSAEKTFGSIVESIEFDDFARNRIIESLRSKSGTPFDALTKHYATPTRNEYWSLCHRDLGIVGFRPGKGKEQVLTRVLNSLDAPVGSKPYRCLWRVYEASAHHFIIDSLPEVNEILLNETVDQDKIWDTRTIFEALCRKAPVYKATSEQLRDLYEVWSFPRIDDFDQIINSVQIDVGLVTEMIKISREETSHEVAEAVRDLGVQVEQRLESIREKLQNLESGFGDFQLSIAQNSEQANADLLSQFEKTIDDRISRLREGQSSAPTVSPVMSQLDTGVVKRLAEQLNSATSRIERIEKYNQKAASAKEIASGHTLPEKKIAGRSTASVLSTWRNSLLESSISINEDKLLLLMSSWKNSNVIVVRDYELIRGLCECLYLPNEITRITASPLWSDQKDWSHGYNFLNRAGGGPRVLVIADFDVALQDAYLIPSMVSWLDSPNSSNSKLILIPSSSSMESLSPRILENGLLADELFFHPETATLESVGAEKFLALDASHLVVKAQVINRGYEEDIRRYAANNQFKLPLRLCKQFSHIASAWHEIASDDQIVPHAYLAVILPWVEKIYGQANGQVLTRYMVDRFEGRA